MFSASLDTAVSVTTLTCRGALDYASVGELEPLLRELTAKPPADTVRFDLSEVSFVDSTGLADLLPVVGHLLRQGTHVLLCAQPPILEVLALFGLREHSHPNLQLEECAAVVPGA